VLKSSAVKQVEVPSAAKIRDMMAQFGPEIRMHPEEEFLPDDPGVILSDA
jgi:hypothetical protein